MSESRRITVNGLVFNDYQVGDPVEYEITTVTGLGEPGAVFTSEQIVGGDGAWATTGYRAPRAIGLEGAVRAQNEILAEQGADQIRRLIDLAEFPVTLHWASGDRTVFCRRDGEVQLASRELPTEFTWSTVLKCLDPRIFAGDGAGSGNVVLATGMPRSEGGLTYPITYPVTYTGTSATGDVDTTLAAGGKLRLRLDGPIPDPEIIVDNAAGQFRLAWSGNLLAGMWLDIDPEKRQVLLQGQTSRVPWIRQWPRLTPGQNTFHLRGSGYDTGSLTVTIQPCL